MVTRLSLTIAFATMLCWSGCGIKVNGGLDPTLHFHSSLKELDQAPVRARLAPARRFSSRLIIEPVAGYYPRPLGLRYSGGGASRKLTSQYMAARVPSGSPERQLTQQLRQRFQAGVGEPVLLTSAIVALEFYNLGEQLYSSAAVEARVVRRGHEVYTARYYARAKAAGGTGGLSGLWPVLEAQLVGQMQADRRLYAALEGRR